MAGSFLEGLAGKEAAKANMGFGINESFKAADPARNSLAGWAQKNPQASAQQVPLSQQLPQQGMAPQAPGGITPEQLQQLQQLQTAQQQSQGLAGYPVS